MKTIFLFPGQGSQYVGMGKALAESHEGARRLLQEADDVLGIKLSALMADGPEDELKATQNTQPALYVVSQMAAAVLAEAGIRPDLAAVGALSFADGLRLVRLRGNLMAEAGVRRPGAMAAILGLDAGPLDEVLKGVSGTVVSANYNCPGQIVVSGEVDAVLAAMEACTAAGAKKAVRLPVSGAFHSPLMEYALEGLRDGLAKATFSKPSCPVVANVDAVGHDNPAEFAELLVKQLVSPVRWENSMRWAVAQGVARGVEVGAGKVLMGLMRSIDRAVSVTPVESVDAVAALKGA